MSQYCRKIHQDYGKYRKVLAGRKIANEESISLEEGKGSHKKWLRGRTNLVFVLSHKGYFSVRQSKSLLIDYGFQVFQDDVEKPILRFDADGATHYNNEDDSLPLLSREIKTPHFHKYDENGKEFAYRTTILDNHEYEIQSDIQLGLQVFCEENYIESPKGEPLKIAAQTEMFPEEIINDLHKGVYFP